MAKMPDHGHGCFCGNCSPNFIENQLPDNENGEVGAFRNFNTPRWGTTATDGSGLQQGDPTTLTWSVLPNGTTIPNGIGEGTGPSDLITRLDDIYHGGSSPGGSDLTQRAWWGLMDSVFDRFESLSGLTYVYEANDDGATAFNNPGVLGVRGDVRIGGKNIDGNSGILGYNFGPNNGDMVLDSNDNFFEGLANNSLRFRNVFAHEHGHGLGMAHVIPVNGTKLMEPTASGSPPFDGPQFDDILNLQRHYGDAFEKANAGQGNETATDAISLGSVPDGGNVEIGADAVGVTSSQITDNQGNATKDGKNLPTDFVSIDGTSDTDFWSFEIAQDALVDLLLTPVGPTYDEGPQGGSSSPFNTSELNDLALALVDTDGTTVIDSSDSGGLGVAESLFNNNLAAGIYFARVTGSIDQVQMYHLNITATFTAIPEPATAGFCGLLLLGLVTRRRRRPSQL